MSENKKLIDLIAKGEDYLDFSDEFISPYNDGMQFTTNIYKSINYTGGIYKHKVSGFFSFENILKIYPELKIIYINTPFIDTLHVCVIQLTPTLRCTGTLQPNIIDFADINSTEELFMFNTLPLNKLHKIGIENLVFGYPVQKLNSVTSELIKLLDLKSIRKEKDTSNSYKLGVVTYTNNQPGIMVKDLSFDSEHEDLELLYNSIDNEFHSTLIDKINSSSKGNIVFNGPPGTGKSFYIRKLIKDYYIKYANKENKSRQTEDVDFYSLLTPRRRNNIDKLFVYIPTNLAHLFSDPTFTSMLQDKAIDYHKGIVIILEDAEKLLVDRDDSIIDTGVSALLNMSDGILNDIISTQFIFTYNTETKHIDSAILRPGRLLAKKTFKNLTAKKANKLALKLGINKKFEGEISLATVFSELQEKENTILIEEENKHIKIGF